MFSKGRVDATSQRVQEGASFGLRVDGSAETAESTVPPGLARHNFKICSVQEREAAQLTKKLRLHGIAVGNQPRPVCQQCIFFVCWRVAVGRPARRMAPLHRS